MRYYTKEEMLESGTFVYWGGNSSWVRVRDTNLLFCFRDQSSDERWFIAGDSQWLSVDEYSLSLIGLYRKQTKADRFIEDADLKYIISGIPNTELRTELAAFFNKDNKLKDD
jgi:hypothetical protein